MNGKEVFQFAIRKVPQVIEEVLQKNNLTKEEKIAIARNNLEIEKALKIIKKKPMSVEKADKQNANPNHVDEFILDSKGAYQDKKGQKK